MWRARPHPPAPKWQDAQRPAGRVPPPCHSRCWGAGVGMPTPSGRKGTEDPSFCRQERCPVRSRSPRRSGQGSGRQRVPAAALGKALCVQICLPRTLLPTAQAWWAIRVPTLPERRGGLEQSHLLGQQTKATWRLADPSGVKRPHACRPLPGQPGQERHLPSEPTPRSQVLYL